MAAPDALEVADNVPHVAPLQPAPESVQLTPLLELSLVTVAVKACPCPTWTDETVGDTLTEIPADGKAGAGTRLLELEVAPAQPCSNSRATIVMGTKDRGAFSANARCTAEVLPRLEYWIS